MDDDNSGLAYFLLGLGIGAAVGMILAPVSGSEARGLLRNKASEGGDYLRRRSEEFRDSATDVVGRCKDLVTRQRDQFSAAVDAGKQAYREAISSPDAGGMPVSGPGGQPL